MLSSKLALSKSITYATPGDEIRPSLFNLGEARRSTLTSREVEVLELLVEAYPNETIAAKLRTSIRTVEHHRAHIFKKMGARSLAHLIKLVLEIRRPGQNQ